MDYVGGTAQVNFHVWNTSTIGSGIRPPVIGYKSVWTDYAAPFLNRTFSSGPMSETTQEFNWSEIVEFGTTKKVKCGQVRSLGLWSIDH